MSALVALAAIDVVAAAMLAAIFAYSAAVGGERHLKRWAVAWGLLALSQLFAANDLLGRPVPFVHVLLPVAGIGTVLFLVAGTDAFCGRGYSHRWTATAVVAAIGVGALESLGVDPFLSAIPVVLMLSLAIGMAAAALIRHRPGRGTHRFAAVALGMWAINTATYPILGRYEEAMPFGTGLSAILQLATGIALLLAHLDRGREALAAAAEQERLLIEHAVMGVVRVDSEGRFMHANPMLLAILGYEDLETLRSERRLADLFADPEERDRWEREGIDTSRQELETLWLRRDGKRRRVRVHGRDVRGADGDSRCFEGFVTDVTERRRLEEELEAARRLQAVGRLTGGIAHDFNNLLTVIQGNLQLAQEENHDQGLVGEALEATERAAELTSQLLTFARAQEGQAKVTDLVPQVSVLARLLGRTLPEPVALHVEHAAPACVAAIPASDLDQVVLNLVVNARDALSGRAGNIRIGTRYEDRGGERWAALTVSDDGPGIDPEVAAVLFEPFTSTRGTGGGSGLGLSIVHDLVKRAGGRVNVSSSGVRGATFEIWLRAARLREAPVVASTRHRRVGGGTILVADDEPTVRRTVGRILERRGYAVELVDGVQSAIAALRPDLTAVLSDIVMQDGDGFEIVEEVGRRGLAVPCLLMSGYPDRVTEGRSIAHAPPILSKPFSPEQLVEALERQILAPTDDAKDAS